MGELYLLDADTIQRFQGSVKLLDAALGHMRDASPKTAVQGRLSYGT